MSCVTEIKEQLAQIYAMGGTVEEIHIAEDIQKEIVSDMLHDAELEFDTYDNLRSISSLRDLIVDEFISLKCLYGYLVVTKPSGSGVQIVYHC